MPKPTSSEALPLLALRTGRLVARGGSGAALRNQAQQGASEKSRFPRPRHQAPTEPGAVCSSRHCQRAEAARATFGLLLWPRLAWPHGGWKLAALANGDLFSLCLGLLLAAVGAAQCSCPPAPQRATPCAAGPGGLIFYVRAVCGARIRPGRARPSVCVQGKLGQPAHRAGNAASKLLCKLLKRGPRCA